MTGIEYERNLFEICEKHLNELDDAIGYCGDFLNHDFRGQSYDVITCMM